MGGESGIRCEGIESRESQGIKRWVGVKADIRCPGSYTIGPPGLILTLRGKHITSIPSPARISRRWPFGAVADRGQ